MHVHISLIQKVNVHTKGEYNPGVRYHSNFIMAFTNEMLSWRDDNSSIHV